MAERRYRWWIVCFALVIWGMVTMASLLFGAARAGANGNLLTNPGFESETTGWSKNGGAFVTVSSPIRNGLLAASFTVTNTTSARYIYQTITNTVPGASYTFSGYVVKNTGDASAVYLRTAWYTSTVGSGTQISTTNSISLTTNDPSYRLLSISVTAPADAHSAQVRAVLDAAQTVTTTVYFDDLSFTLDSTPTSTLTPTNSPTYTNTPSPTATPISTSTNTPTNTPTHTNTTSRTATSTSTATSTATRTPTPTATSTSTPTLTNTPTNTAMPTSFATTIFLNEFLPKPKNIDWNSDGLNNSDDEWIELYNAGTTPVDLSGWKLDDVASGGTSPYSIPSGTTIAPHGFLIFFKSQTNIGLNDTGGDDVRLLFPDDTVADATSYVTTADDQSYARSTDGAGAWTTTCIPSPNAANCSITPTPTATPTATFTSTPSRTATPSPTPTNTPTPTAPPPAANLLITEVLYDGTQTDEGDEFIEIFNPTSSSVDLSNYKIGDEETAGGGEGMYIFPTGATLAANSIVIIARNAEQFKNRFGFYPDFECVPTGTNLTDAPSVPNLSKYTQWASGSLALSNSGDEVLLLGPSDQIVGVVAWGSGSFSAVGLAGDASAPEPKSLQRYGTSDANQMTFDFLAGTPAPGARVTPPAFPAVPAPAAMPGGMYAYWGDLHAHSTASDGDGPPRMAFDLARAAGLHFFALTDHDSWLTLEEWNEIGNAARAATADNAFIALRGFEYSHSTKGHVGVFNTDTWVSRDDPNYDTLSEFYAWLAAQPNAIAQFNHPDAVRGGDFDHFSFNAAAFDKIVLQEVGNNAHAAYVRYETQLTSSLNKRWHIAPTNNSDNHALNWGSDSPHRVGVLAPALTQSNLLDAFRARRVFATEDSNLAIGLQANGAWMGTTIRTQPTINFTLTASDPDAEPCQVFLYDNGAIVRSQSFASSNLTWTISLPGSSSHYYFVRIVQSDGDTAYTAPIWTDDTPLPTPNPPTETPRDNPNDLGWVSIATARTARLNTYVNVQGCVTVPPRVLSDRVLFIQDAAGGIKVYLSAKRGDFPALRLGNCLSLRGQVRLDFGERELEVEDPATIQVRGAGSLFSPTRYATGAIDKTLEGLLVEVSGTVTSTTANDLILNDGSGDAQIHIDATTGIRWPTLAQGQPIRVIGVVSRWRGKIAILPRYASDLDFGLRPAPTPTRFVPTPRPTVMRTPTPTLSGTDFQSPTPRIAAAETAMIADNLLQNESGVVAENAGAWSPRAFMRPTLAPVESATTIDARAIAVVGGSASIAMSFVMFALALITWRRPAR